MDNSTLSSHDIQGLYASVYRESFADFFRDFWTIACPEKLVDNWHLDYLCSELEQLGRRVIDRLPKAYDLLINIPPGETKSTLITQLFPAWLWAMDPTLKIIAGSYVLDLALDHAQKSRDLIRSHEFQTTFGVDIRPDLDNKSHFANTDGGERLSVSVGSRLTGFHAHVLIIDDPINPSQAYSEAHRTNALDWMRRVLPSRKVDENVTPTILVMQRLHENDPTTQMLEGGGVKHICLPATDDYPVKPAELKKYYVDGLLNPQRKNRAVLDDRRIKLGSSDFASQYGQQPAPETGNIIQKEWFRQYDPANKNARQGFVNFVIDPAYTSDKSNDPTAILAYRATGANVYLMESAQVWMEFPELCRFIQSFATRNQYSPHSRIYIEPKASGKSIVQSLKASTGLNVMEAPLPQGDKVSRVHGITAMLEAGRCFLPFTGAWVDGFVNECAVFPRGRDDQVDCLTMAMNQASRPQKYRML